MRAGEITVPDEEEMGVLEEAEDRVSLEECEVPEELERFEDWDSPGEDSVEGSNEEPVDCEISS